MCTHWIWDEEVTRPVVMKHLEQHAKKLDSAQKPSGHWRLLNKGMAWSDLHLEKNPLENKLEGQDWNQERQCAAIDIIPVKNADGLSWGCNRGGCQEEKKGMYC